MIDRIEFFHSNNLIHRDIKPENYVMGSIKSLKTLYMIDYGIAKLYRSQKGDHISFKTGKGLIGTARYAGINSHLGNE
jgi:casein kinase 1